MPKLAKSIIIEAEKGDRPSFFAFEIFITPLLVQLYFILCCIFALVCAVQIVYGTWTGQATGAAQVAQQLGINGYLFAAITLVVGIILCRVQCEFIVVVFKIYQELRKR